MKRRLERDGATMEVETIDRMLFVSGAVPSSRTFFDEDAALAAMAELIEAKRTEGWTAVEPPPAPAPARPKAKRAASKVAAKKQLLAQLEPALTPASLELLQALLAHAKVRYDAKEDQLCCVLGDEAEELRIDGSPAAEIPSAAPPSLARFLAVCGGMLCGERGETGQLALHAGDGTLSTVGADALNEKACGFPFSDELFSPIDVNLQSFYVVHPGTGQLLRHDSEGTVEPAKTDDPVEAYLLEVAARFGINAKR